MATQWSERLSDGSEGGGNAKKKSEVKLKKRKIPRATKLKEVKKGNRHYKKRSLLGLFIHKFPISYIPMVSHSWVRDDHIAFEIGVIFYFFP